MKKYLFVTDNDKRTRVFGVLNDCDYCRIEIENEFIIDCFKEHNHKYLFKAFFYNSKRIYPNIYCNSKSKLYAAIQHLLQEELYNV